MYGNRLLKCCPNFSGSRLGGANAENALKSGRAVSAVCDRAHETDIPSALRVHLSRVLSRPKFLCDPVKSARHGIVVT